MTAVCLIAGRGGLPNQIVASLKKQGQDFRIIGLKDNLEGHDFECDRVIAIDKWKQLRDSFQEWQVDSVVFAGKIDRPNVTKLRPDLLLLRYLPRLKLGKSGDDHIMQQILTIFHEDFGLNILSIQEILSQDSKRPEGSLGHYIPNKVALEDIERGQLALNAMSEADFGQAIAVEGGVILGVEAIEGTDVLIQRCQEYKKVEGDGVVVKMPKLQQDNRIDPPTIGADTISALHFSGFAGIAISTDDMIIIDEDSVISLADELGLFIYAIDNT